MRKSVARQVSGEPSFGAVPPMLNGTFNPAFFRQLQETYESRTGYNLVLSDTNGAIQMGLPDCDKFPCMRSCRECREQIVSEALRTGKVCIDACHQGYILWGLPFAVNGKTVGGLIVIGGEQEGVLDEDKFSDACAELYRLMEEHQILPDLSHLGPKDLGNIHRFVHRKDFQQLREQFDQFGKELIDSMQMAEFEAAEKHFNKLRSAFMESPDLPVDLLRGLVGDLVYETKRQFTRGGMDAYAAFSEAGSLLHTLSSAQDKAAIMVLLESFFNRFSLFSRQSPKNPDDLLIEKATTYLENHISEDLTRESVAKAVGISPSHFSRLIREKKGRTFTDLLNQYRIERACMLLVRSSNTLAHIANETGFCDQSYFSKVFRRYKDMSPAKYRETHRL
ncbi:MAG: helix-turn-helix domain-containing protein [Puniceicoccaceae bacterium]